MNSTMQNQKQINPSSSVVSSNNNAIVTENNKIYANLNNLKNNGYVVSNWFSFWSIVNIIFSVCWAYWPIKMQEIEVERREWSNFCQPISDCGKSFGGVLIFFALFQLISYIAAIRQKNRSLPPNITLCFFYLSVLAYCVIIVITIISGIVINQSESGQWCGYESPPFKKEATNFFEATCFIIIPLLCILRLQYKKIRQMLAESKVAFANNPTRNNHHSIELSSSNTYVDNIEQDDDVEFDSVENVAASGKYRK